MNVNYKVLLTAEFIFLLLLTASKPRNIEISTAPKVQSQFYFTKRINLINHISPLNSKTYPLLRDSEKGHKAPRPKGFRRKKKLIPQVLYCEEKKK